MTRIQAGLADARIWVLFFLIGFGLGYPALNRYDIRKAVPDVAIYAQLATYGPSAIQSPLRFRVLVPLLSRIIFRLAQGHTGSWDSLTFAFLFVNSAFVATAAYLLTKVGSVLLPNPAASLLGAALYLLNFAIANVHLAALVDGGEACLLMALVTSMFFRRWQLLPFIGVLGALTKESFVPFSIVMAISWWVALRSGKSMAFDRAIGYIATMATAEFVTLIILQSAISGHIIWPWNFALGLNSPTSYVANFLHSFVDRSSWYILIWLLPLGLVRVRDFPQPWISAAGMAGLTAILLNAYHSTVGGGGGGIGRYVFNVAGPLLSLSAAAFLCNKQLPNARLPEPSEERSTRNKSDNQIRPEHLDVPTRSTNQN